MKKVLITGGNGYIAQSLVKALQNQYNIVTVSRDDFDLTNYYDTCKFFESKYFDTIIHTAVVGGNRLKQEDEKIISQNLDMYYNLISNKSHFGEFLSFGSGAELNSLNTPYGYSKRIIAESMAKRDYCINLRIFAVFDENELDRRFIKSNLLRYLTKQEMVVHENKAMDFFYMKDLVALVDYFLTNGVTQHSAIDCVYEKSYTLCEIAEIINRLDSYKVGISVALSNGSDYIGSYKPLPIAPIGLELGIKEVYFKLKTKQL